ncbi:MAG: class I SAM-dependent methyltransferase [Bacteroidia bacterium]|nr:class I SAM-dependent methyltransferase [Bacteroidia bacterium]
MEDLELPVKDGYDQWAPDYDKCDNPMLYLDEMALSRCIDYPLSNKIALDLGCGTGRHSVRMAAEGATVTALDISEGMITEARKKTGADKVNFTVHDLEKKFDIPDDGFDLVLSSLVLEHICNLQQFFSEIHRVCKNDGNIIVTSMHPSMLLKGTQANFKNSEGRRTMIAGPNNQMSDYLNAISHSGLILEETSEYFGNSELSGKFERARRYEGWPMLVCFMLKNT